MNRSKLLPLALLLCLICPHSASFSQEDGGGNDSADPVKYIPHPPELFEHFSPVEEGRRGPLQLGDANERVRELQASLNRELHNVKIDLGQGVYVGDAQGPDLSDTEQPQAKRKVRIVFSEDRNKAFVVRGNWKPLDGSGEPIMFPAPHQDHLALSKSVEMPDEPLKVDGVFGQHTEAAVAVFQWHHKLPVTGVVDVVTLDKLEPMVPTNPLLAVVMDWVSTISLGPFLDLNDEDDDNNPYWVKTCTAIVITLIIFLGAGVAFQIARTLANSTRFLSRWLFTPSSSPWFTALREHRVFLLAAQLAPAIFIYLAALAIFPRPDETSDHLPYLNVFQNWRLYIANLGLAYLSLVLMLVSFAIADTFDTVFNPDRETENPIGSIIRAAKRLIGVIGTLMICASLAGRHPFYIIGALGAFTAIFMLVFKDYLLGLVASVQIIANKVVKVGDWIAMPKFNADGDVQQISLSLIKVQNFDKTVSTIPTSSVLSESFRNWTGMQTAGGRRIKRSIHIDMHSIRVCTPEMIRRFEKIELISDYIREKTEELAEYNRTHDAEASKVNCRRLTNIGTFRAYLQAYLATHAGLSSDMTFLVRHLQPTSRGLPIEIYAFCNETEWARYEAIQADVFDHVLAILPEFALQTFQEITDAESAGSDQPKAAQVETSLNEVEQLVDRENAELSEKPRRRLATGLRKVRQRIEELDLEQTVEAIGSGRIISLQYRFTG